MNKQRRKVISTAIERLVMMKESRGFTNDRMCEICADIDRACDEESEAYDSLPDGLAMGERAMDMLSNVSDLTSASMKLDDILSKGLTEKKAVNRIKYAIERLNMVIVR